MLTWLVITDPTRARARPILLPALTLGHRVLTSPVRVRDHEAVRPLLVVREKGDGTSADTDNLIIGVGVHIY
jgi:hypothetical protein